MTFVVSPEQEELVERAVDMASDGTEGRDRKARGLANLARSEAQLSAIAVIATMSLAALGGCWWPIEVTPSWMQDLAIYLPTGWTMDAMHQLINFGNDVSGTIPHLLALSIGTLVLGLFAVRTFRYQ